MKMRLANGAALRALLRCLRRRGGHFAARLLPARDRRSARGNESLRRILAISFNAVSRSTQARIIERQVQDARSLQ